VDGQRFAISYDKTAWLATLSGVGPNSSGVEVDTDQVRVRMGSAFRLDIPRDHIRSVRRSQVKLRGTRGVHRWPGRWLVAVCGSPGSYCRPSSPVGRCSGCSGCSKDGKVKDEALNHPTGGGQVHVE
jgi:hypothetical protein